MILSCPCIPFKLAPTLTHLTPELILLAHQLDNHLGVARFLVRRPENHACRRLVLGSTVIRELESPTELHRVIHDRPHGCRCPLIGSSLPGVLDINEPPVPLQDLVYNLLPCHILNQNVVP